MKKLASLESAAGLAGEVHLPDFEPSLHSKSSSVFWGEAETQLLFYINHVSCQSMPPLSFFPGNRIQRFYHLAICFIFAFSVISTNRIIYVMLSSNGICFSCWIYIKLKNFSSGWIIAKLILQWVVRPCVVMSSMLKGVLSQPNFSPQTNATQKNSNFPFFFPENSNFFQPSNLTQLR